MGDPGISDDLGVFFFWERWGGDLVGFALSAFGVAMQTWHVLLTVC